MPSSTRVAGGRDANGRTRCPSRRRRSGTRGRCSCSVRSSRGGRCTGSTAGWRSSMATLEDEWFAIRGRRPRVARGDLHRPDRTRRRRARAPGARRVRRERDLGARGIRLRESPGRGGDRHRAVLDHDRLDRRGDLGRTPDRARGRGAAGGGGTRGGRLAAARRARGTVVRRRRGGLLPVRELDRGARAQRAAQRAAASDAASVLVRDRHRDHETQTRGSPERKGCAATTPAPQPERSTAGAAPMRSTKTSRSQCERSGSRRASPRPMAPRETSRAVRVGDVPG